MSCFNPPRRNDAPASAVTIALYRISQAIGHVLRVRGEAMQLSPAQMQALLFLKYARPGVRTIGGLAARLAATYATTSGVADALERKQFARRNPLPEDRRTVTLVLTVKGNRAAESLEDMLDEVEAAIESLPEADQRVLVRATQAIVRRLQEGGHVQVYEMCWGCQFFRQNAHPDDPRGPHHCAFVDAPLSEPNTYLECPDFVPAPIMKGGDSVPLPLTLYGATDCDDTACTRERLRQLGIPFREVNIDHDPDAERFVIFINGGYRSTPTLVFGEGKHKTILTEPTNAELNETLAQAGYRLNPGSQL